MSTIISPVTPSVSKRKRSARLDKSADLCQTVPMVNVQPVQPVIEISKMSENSNTKGQKKMSKSETSPTTPTPITIKKNVKFFDLTTFAEDKKEINVSFTPAATYEDAVARLGNDETALVNAINNILQARAISEEKKKVLGDKAVGKKVVLQFIFPFRMTPPYSTMVTLEKGQPGWKDQYNKQTAALVKSVASNEFMLNAIRAAAAASSEDDDDESEDNG